MKEGGRRERGIRGTKRIEKINSGDGGTEQNWFWCSVWSWGTSDAVRDTKRERKGGCGEI